MRPTPGATHGGTKQPAPVWRPRAVRLFDLFPHGDLPFSCGEQKRPHGSCALPSRGLSRPVLWLYFALPATASGSLEPEPGPAGRALRSHRPPHRCGGPHIPISLNRHASSPPMHRTSRTRPPRPSRLFRLPARLNLIAGRLVHRYPVPSGYALRGPAYRPSIFTPNIYPLMCPVKTPTSPHLGTSDEALKRRLREGLEILGISMAAIARRTGVDYKNVQRWITGDTTIPAAFLASFAAAVPVDPRWLLTGEGEAEPAEEQRSTPSDRGDGRRLARDGGTSYGPVLVELSGSDAQRIATLAEIIAEIARGSIEADEGAEPPLPGEATADRRRRAAQAVSSEGTPQRAAGGGPRT